MSEGSAASEGSGAGTRRLHLRRWHRDRGARLVARRGGEVPASYGDPSTELEILKSGLALVDHSDGGRLELLGADRRRFLNGLVTMDVTRLEPGEALDGYATDVKGRILGDVTALAHDDRLWLLTPPARDQPLREHLLRYRVADRVEVLPMSDLMPLTLAGAGLDEALRATGVEPPAAHSPPWAHRRADLFGTEVHFERTGALGVPALRVWVSTSIAAAVADDLCARLGAAPVGDDACEVVRLEAGIGRFGVDFDDSNLPGEVALEGRVDWKKGCYLGQEIVARLHYRGQPARRLRRLHIDGERSPEVGEAVGYEEREAGTVSSVARSPRHGLLALAMLQRRATETGTVVTLASGVTARVEEPAPLS